MGWLNATLTNEVATNKATSFATSAVSSDFEISTGLGISSTLIGTTTVATEIVTVPEGSTPTADDLLAIKSDTTTAAIGNSTESTETTGTGKTTIISVNSSAVSTDGPTPATEESTSTALQESETAASQETASTVTPSPTMSPSLLAPYFFLNSAPISSSTIPPLKHLFMAALISPVATWI